jgi:limonene-1,2-epoxide hydrolase
VRRLAALAAALAVAAAGAAAASSAEKPTAVVRAWSKALNTNNNEAAARLFAMSARIVQPGLDVRLMNHDVAVGFNDSLPCAGRITRLDVKGNQIVATFVLGERPKHHCDAPGVKAAALFVIHKGKITLWAQVPVPPDKRPTA